MIPRLVTFLVLTAAAGFGQDAAKRTAFDVASLRQYAPPRDGPTAAMRCNGGPGTADPERLNCANAPLAMLICIAYDVQYYQVTGPGWIGTNGYDVAAKIPAGATRAQFRLMLQDLLAERFQLVLRGGTKDMLSYTLVIAKGGIKMQRPGDGAAAPLLGVGSVGGRTRITARKQPMGNLAGFL